MKIKNPLNMFRRVMSDPKIDWTLIVALSFVAAVALVGVGVYVYLGAESLLDAPAVPTTPVRKAFDPVQLSEVISDSALRAAVWKDQAAHYPIAPDPSLP